MGDDEDRAAARGEMARQPVDPFDVEMVRRLVEQQQLGLVEEQLGERDPPALTAGQRRDDGVEPVGEARDVDATEQPVEDAAERGVAGPLVIGAVADQLVADRAQLVQLVALPEHLHAQRAGARHRTGVRGLQPGDQAQQRGLAVAVASDDADPVAGGDAERDVAQHGAAAVSLVDRFQVDEVARGGGHLACILAGGGASDG